MTTKPSKSPPSGGLRSVGGQLAAVIATGLSTAFVVIFATQIEWSSARSFDEELDRKTYTTELMAAQLYGAVRWRKPGIIRKVYESIEAHDAGGIAAAVTMHGDGSSLSTYGADGDGIAALERLIQSYLIAERSAKPATQLSEDRFTVIAPVVSDDGAERFGALAITWKLDNLIATTNDAVLKQSGIALASLGTILAVALLFIRQRISRPMEQITEATNHIASGDKKFQVPLKGRRDEIGAMARALVTFQQNVALIDRLTAEQQAQNQRLHQALEKEREYNALHREFVSMVSHEFRTPMAIIDGAAQRIQRRIGNDTPERLQERIAKIRSAVARMIELIESTLSVSRMEAGTIELEITDCDLASLLTEICQRQQEIASKHEIDLRIADLPASLRADRARLDQVFTNLLSNAVKYAPETPRIDVKAGTIGSNVVVSVRDFGVGIPKDELPRLFQKFYRASTSTGIPGTGIGLHLVKHLVELHGGTVCAESTVGQSTTFSVTLPMAPVRAEAQSAAQSGAAPPTAAATA